MAVQNKNQEMAAYLKALEPEGWHNEQEKVRQLMPYKLPAKLVEYLKTGPLRLEFPERELVKWAELYPYMDVQEMTWKRKKLLSLMAKMDNYSDYLLLWSPRDKKLWYLDIEHNRRFSSYWNSDNNMTYPLILAKIPVKNPWEIFAYLPFGGWNECPNTPELMAVAKYWFEQHGAVPAAMSHDELEFLLPAPVSEEKAMDAAVELYGFCPDVIDQGPEDATVGALADVLRQSTVWYFWWD